MKRNLVLLGVALTLLIAGYLLSRTGRLTGREELSLASLIAFTANGVLLVVGTRKDDMGRAALLFLVMSGLGLYAFFNSHRSGLGELVAAIVLLPAIGGAIIGTLIPVRQRAQSTPQNTPPQP